MNQQSLPVWGVWIEMRIELPCFLIAPRHSLYGECGLKLYAKYQDKGYTRHSLYGECGLKSPSFYLHISI